MTRAPKNLLAVRSLLLTHLNVDKDSTRSADLESAEVGIVGDTAHQQQGDSYHLGKPEQRLSGYSVSESARDRALTEYASALDVGSFSVRVAGKAHTLPSFSLWCVGQCVANAPDTRDIREIIYSPDGSSVKRWDRLGKRTSGDDSHLWHTHFSFFRDAIKAGRDQTPLFRRYLTTIGLLEDDMTPAELFAAELYNPVTKAKAKYGEFIQSINSEAYKGRLTSEAVLGAVKGLDTKAILARIDQVAADDRQRDTELADLLRKQQSGELTAEQVLAKLRDLLPADAPQS